MLCCCCFSAISKVKTPKLCISTRGHETLTKDELGRTCSLYLKLLELSAGLVGAVS